MLAKRDVLMYRSQNMKKFVFSLVFAICLTAAKAELKVDIFAGNAEPVPIAIAKFDSIPANEKISGEIRAVVENDLKSSGLFHIISDSAHPEGLKFDVMPKFQKWGAVKAKVLIQSKLTRTKDKKLRLQFYVWDINGKEQVEAQSLVASAESARRLAHIMADAIYVRLTGEGAYFDSQIVLTAQTGGYMNPKKRLAIMDSDGANFRFISDDRTYVLSPHFSPNMQTIVFLSYRGDEPNIWTLDMTSGEHRKLGRFDGMNFAARWSPDGRRIAFSLVDGRGASNIYEYDIETKKIRRLTNTDGINTSPSYSPDGLSLAYNSNSSGSQQLHVLDLNTLRTRRISYGDGRYATPAFSPDGKYLAFTKIADDTFFIGVMSPNGRNEKILAGGWYMESPSWAPNSRRLVYYETEKINDGDERQSSIRSVDILGHFNYEIKTPDEINGMDPTWSPILP
ncbi:MAG: Tol-Pal system beta propeller repeat protein TolB [Rickettsiales bacterium]|jgi:TolB protein|nr:Tol-Pal system beta propeller repeat protein TolB [Rickettsiales bacterium]